MRSYLESNDSTYKKLYYASQLASWATNTHIVEGDCTTPTTTAVALPATFCGA